MTDHYNKKQEYQERHRFWADKRIAQLSFHNNLLLTLGFAIIGYFWSERSGIYTKLIIDFESDIEWKVLCFLLGLVLSTLSVLAGFTLSMSRLYDLRLTANIALTRKRALDKNISINEEEVSKSGIVVSLLSLISVMWCYEKYNINKSEITNSDDFSRKFKKLRQKASDLGEATWCLLLWQTLCMLFAFIFFVTTLALK